MAKYEIINIVAGVVWGTYEGDSELDAYLAMLTDAGYDEKNLPPGEKAKSWDEIEINDENFIVRENGHYHNEDDFIDSQGGNREELAQLAKDSDFLAEFCECLPYPANTTDEVVQKFYKQAHK